MHHMRRLKGQAGDLTNPIRSRKEALPAIHVDLIDMKKEPGYDGSKWALHFIDETLSYHWLELLDSKSWMSTKMFN